MKRIKYIAIGSLSVVTMLLGMSACSNLDELAESGDGTFALSASSSAVSVSTRAADSEQFAEGTKYYLYALDANSLSWSSNYMNSTPDGNYTLGTETSSHTIQYDGNNKFGGKTLNFYGVTESSTSENKEFITAGSGSSAPTVTASYTDNGSGLNVLPDYMWANLNGQTFKNAGTIALPFIHTTSKLNFYVNAGDDAAASFQIKSIELLDYKSGSLDMTTGKFKADNSYRNEASSSWNQVFSGSQKLTSTSAALTDSKGNVERYIFPTRDNSETFTVGSSSLKHSLGIKIGLSNGNTFTYWTKQVAMNSNNQPKTDSEGNYLYKPFQFDPNYQYDVLLTVTSSALVVTILPRYYGWISNKEEQTNTSALTEIGNPVTFGGVVWADRNLGATSADPTASAMDWERSRGWYYQFGRSIPYYIKGSMQDPDHINDTRLTTSNIPAVPQNAWTLNDNNSKPFPFVANHYTDGPIVLNGPSEYAYDVTDGKFNPDLIKSSYFAEQLAKIPSATSGHFNFVFDLTNYDDYPQGPASCPFDWDYNHSTSAKYWNTEEQQPCPKGWRLPTKDEVLSIYPCDPLCGDITFNPTTNSSQGTNIPGYHILRGNHDFAEITYNGDKSSSSSGWYVDFKDYTDTDGKVSKRDGVYVGVKSSNTFSGTIYCIKNQGKSNAYRIKWEIKNAPSSGVNGDKVSNRQVLVISRYPASSTDDLKKKSGDKYIPDYKKYDWEHPSEQLKLPISGMVYGRYSNSDSSICGVKLLYPGVWGLYWTSDAYTDENSAYSMRVKIDFGDDTGQRALFTYGQDRRGFGGNIRCVRDDSVVDK